ncbi:MULTISPECIES: hypothetical protein [unclassified Streptomyces]|nr:MULTISPECIES: hypothetical protein [unclassified Streptomyces]
MRATGCRPWPTHWSPTHHRKERHGMNLLTDVLAGLVHLIGWLV